MYMFVQITIHFLWMGFHHVHVCTNHYPFPCVWIFVMHISVGMTVHFFVNGFSSCTCLYKWLSISLWICIYHVLVCTNDYPFPLNRFSSCTFLYEWLPIIFEWIFVMHVSVRMTTISFWMDCRHARFCAHDYHLFLNGLSSCAFLYKWLPFLFKLILVMHLSVQRTTIYFLNGLSSCTFLCKWLPFRCIWFFVTHILWNKFTYSLHMDFRHAHFCANDFPYSFGFSMCAMLFNAWIAWCSDKL